MPTPDHAKGSFATRQLTWEYTSTLAGTRPHYDELDGSARNMCPREMVAIRRTDDV
ncbi:hypothetical protein PAXRUDRAFT_829442 [Paxillus rubicundulus Ve08.2h10]|uniref:Uncharacterized protein n=1 Tax=Paxillus rubicundulus Ve08.2h10 TaxID=930991 RepID=A0A0D0E600_9AGAM|nr:hypothetical protein PAXRUDRAFT_829442 [Paxillus rubicundulus Ve08.2h10]